MRRARFCLVMLAFLLHHNAVSARGEDVETRREDTETQAELEPVFRFSRARITLANEKRFLGTSLTLQGDSLSYYRVLRERSVGYDLKTPEESDRRRIPLKNIDRVEVGRRSEPESARLRGPASRLQSQTKEMSGRRSSSGDRSSSSSQARVSERSSAARSRTGTPCIRLPITEPSLRQKKPRPREGGRSGASGGLRRAEPIERDDWFLPT
jgi:hypothetical protein